MQGSNYIADFVVLFLVASCAAQSVDTSTVTLTAQPAFSVQPACVQSCLFWEFGDNVDYLLFGLGCTSTIYNECYCTQIVDQSAQTIISTCVHTLCSGTTEISNAISLYESYCNGAGYPRTVSASQTSSTTSSSTPASTTPSSTTPTTTPTSTSSPSSAATSSVATSSTTSPSSPSSTTASSTESSSGTSSSTPSASPSQSSKNDASSMTGSYAGALIAGLVLVAGIIYTW